MLLNYIQEPGLTYIGCGTQLSLRLLCHQHLMPLLQCLCMCLCCSARLMMVHSMIECFGLAFHLTLLGMGRPCTVFAVLIITLSVITSPADDTHIMQLAVAHVQRTKKRP